MNQRCIAYVSFLLLLSACSSMHDDSTGKTPDIISLPEQSEKILLEDGISAYNRGLYRIATQSLETLCQDYPGSYWATLAELKIADAHYYSRKLNEAQGAYNEFIRKHPRHKALPYVRFMVGLSHLKEYRGELRDQSPLIYGRDAFSEVVKHHSDSDYAPLALKGIKLCREQLAAYELHVAKFYIRQKKNSAALARLNRIVSDYKDCESAASAKKLLKVFFQPHTITTN